MAHCRARLPGVNKERVWDAWDWVAVVNVKQRNVERVAPSDPAP